MKHKNESINYLDLIPQRAETLRWHTDEQTGLITLEVENTGLFNTIAQKVFSQTTHHPGPSGRDRQLSLAADRRPEDRCRPC